MLTLFIGDTYSVFAIAVIAVAGGVALAYLVQNAGFAFYDHSLVRRGLRRAILAGTLFVIPTILVDLLAPYPANINLPLPGAAWFYPLIALVAEAGFHLIPMALLLWLSSLLVGKFASMDRQAGRAILVVACLEPLFQVFAAPSTTSGWVLAYLALHLYAFNLVQLHLFRRYGFVTMYALRIVYYLWWHLLWGALRLELLF